MSKLKTNIPWHSRHLEKHGRGIYKSILSIAVNNALRHREVAAYKKALDEEWTEFMKEIPQDKFIECG